MHDQIKNNEDDLKNLKDIWEKIIKGSGLPEERVSLWLSTCEPIKIENNELIIDAQNLFVQEFITKNFLKELNISASQNEHVNSVKLTCQVSHEGSEKWQARAKEASENNSAVTVKISPINANLNSGYTFETFVVGKSNRLAHAASLAVAEMPGKAYNPLFIWGGVGLGKTHLMHAICHHALSLSGNLRVQYLGTEKFLNDFVQAIASSKMREFRERYRSVDILLIDDIQFLGNKDQSQEEFYNTFNTLRDMNRQVVICSDRPPSKLLGIEDRLISRFAWGLVADIQPPDFETRIAILQKKAAMKNYDLPNDVAGFIARHIPSNIRELEGALNRVIVSSELKKEPITIEKVKIWLKDILKDDQIVTNISINDIKNIVAEYFNVESESMNGTGRTNEVALARQTAMYLCRIMTNINSRQIAKEFKKKDHVTVIHAEKKVSNLMKNDNEFQKMVNEIKDRLNALYYW